MGIIKKIYAWKGMFRRSPLATTIFACLLGVIVIINCVAAARTIISTRKLRRTTPFYFLGSAFSSFEEALAGKSHIGYYTDKDLGKTVHAAQFAQAQFILAPVILDTDYRKYEFIILDCSSLSNVLEKMRGIGAVPVKINAFGIVLARRLP